VSLCSQLAYTYSANRKSRTPFHSVLFTSLDGKTRARLDALGAQYKRWQYVDFWEAGYDRMWGDQAGEGDGTQSCTQESVVYLTGDADEELQELKEGETYIIGGICDHNRYKARRRPIHSIRYSSCLLEPMPRQGQIPVHPRRPSPHRDLPRTPPHTQNSHSVRFSLLLYLFTSRARQESGV
jgi:tRNA (Guanine-1)-methyltransferase